MVSGPHPEDIGQRLRIPKGRFQETIRRLAEAAIAVTHHDAGQDEPGYIHEVKQMERRFTDILRGKLFTTTPASAEGCQTLASGEK